MGLSRESPFSLACEEFGMDIVYFAQVLIGVVFAAWWLNIPREG